jgi:DNA ligase-1
MGTNAIGMQEAEKYDFRRIDEVDGHFPDGWRLPTLVWIDQLQNERSWLIYFDGVDSVHTVYGRTDGKMQESAIEIVPKVKRNMDQQAFLEARRKYMDKMAEGYLPIGSTLTPQTKPMLADKYEAKYVTSWPVYVQPKLDGKRLISYIQPSGDVILKSREGRPHLSSDYLKQPIKHLLQYLPPGSVLDGELYNDDITFQELISIAQKKETIKDAKKLQFYIFDIDYTDNHRPSYDERYDTLVSAYNLCVEDYPEVFDHLVILEADIAYCHQDVLNKMEQYEQQGYEGIMVKKIANDISPRDKEWKTVVYHYGRSRNIMKLKSFTDEEATIVGVVNGKGKEKDLATAVVDWNGTEVKVSLNYPREIRAHWWRHPEEIIGQPLTIRYQELTNDGIPRFPKGVGIRDYE